MVAAHYGNNAEGAEETVTLITALGGKAQAFQADTGKVEEIEDISSA